MADENRSRASSKPPRKIRIDYPHYYFTWRSQVYRKCTSCHLIWLLNVHLVFPGISHAFWVYSTFFSLYRSSTKCYKHHPSRSVRPRCRPDASRPQPNDHSDGMARPTAPDPTRTLMVLVASSNEASPRPVCILPSLDFLRNLHLNSTHQNRRFYRRSPVKKKNSLGCRLIITVLRVSFNIYQFILKK